MCTHIAVCDSASCNSASSVSVTKYVIIRQNEIKNVVYNLATKIAPFVYVQQCRVPTRKTAVYCSCVEYVREWKIIVLMLCESKWNFPSGSDCYFRDRGNGKSSCGQALWWSASKSELIWSVSVIHAGLEPCSRRMQFKTIEMGQQYQSCGMWRSIATVSAQPRLTFLAAVSNHLCRIAPLDIKEYSWQFWFVSPNYYNISTLHD